MSNDRLWAPWRLGYVQGDQPEHPPASGQFLPGADKSCFICRAAAESDDRRNLVIERGPGLLTILNRYPYNNGHLLVAPALHVPALKDIPADQAGAMQQLLANWVERLGIKLRAEGFNVGLNLGRTAGAGLPGHLHWHIVPRWNGDTNFMPTLAGIKVIPQSLDSLWELLAETATLKLAT